jgi:Spy/CpxP family protein refolding chaperone
MKALHEETQSKMNQVLTPAQQEKLAEMKEQRKARWEERKENWKENKGKRGE